MPFQNIFVDPQLNNNSGTGTEIDPFGDLQYALNQQGTDYTRDAVNGDQFNIIADTDEVLTGVLNFGTYGTPTQEAPCVFRGMSRGGTPNDGGIGGISGGGSFSMLAGQTEGVGFMDLHLHSSGSNTVVMIGTGAAMHNCEVNGTTGTAVYLGAGLVTNCNIHGFGVYGIEAGSTHAEMYGNYIDAQGASRGIDMIQDGQRAMHNMIICDGTAVGIRQARNYAHIANNSIVGLASAGTGILFSTSARDERHRCYNNVVSGFSNSGTGIDYTAYPQPFLISAGNAVYDCTTEYDKTGATFWLESDEILSGDPFAGGTLSFANRFEYFKPQDVGGMLLGAYPFGCNLPKGAVGTDAGGGGSIAGVAIMPRLRRK